jgi:hypothetical protein
MKLKLKRKKNTRRIGLNISETRVKEMKKGRLRKRGWRESKWKSFISLLKSKVGLIKTNSRH